MLLGINYIVLMRIAVINLIKCWLHA